MSISGLFTKTFERFPDYQREKTMRNFSSRTDVFLKGPLFAKSTFKFGAVRKFCFQPYGRKFGKFGLKALFVSCAFIVPVTEASADHESTNEQDFRGCSHDINQCSLIGNQQVRPKNLKPKHFRLISFKDLKNRSFK